MSIDVLITERVLLQATRARIEALLTHTPDIRWTFDYDPLCGLPWQFRLNDGKGFMLALPGQNLDDCIRKAEALYSRLGYL